MTATRKLWTDEHQRQLRQARLGAGVSDVAFARDNAIALRHLKQLEEGGSSAFYSESIKYDMGAKLLKRLGVEPVVPADALVSLPQAESTPSLPLPHADATVPDLQGVDELRSDARPAKRVTYMVMSLAGLGLIGAGISQIPSIHQPGATQGVAQTQVSLATSPALLQTPVVAADDGGATQLPGTIPVSLTTGSTPLTEMTRPQAVIPESCEASGTPQTVVPSQPSKSADYVYITAISDVTLCVRDAAGQITRKALQGGQSFNVPGRQPFELTADKLDQLRVFFQGQRIWFETGAARLRLTAATASD
jgi:hypothetical protein